MWNQEIRQHSCRADVKVLSLGRRVQNLLKGHAPIPIGHRSREYYS